ncbi:hypothetical protein [Micromonospora sp. NPDC005413]|uniref:hypothetical protein n=1 Tax=Micromonospora sp. NPDC005413 TaxID=3154563 RepID=UPI0033BFA4B7
MLIDDLGDPRRTATSAEAAGAAGWVHAVVLTPGLPTVEQAGLARLPRQALDAGHRRPWLKQTLGGGAY